LFSANAAGPSDSATSPGLARLILEKLQFFLVSLIFSALAMVAQHSTRLLALSLPLERRLQNAALAYWAYIGKALWPARLSIFYPYPKSAPPWMLSASALRRHELLEIRP